MISIVIPAYNESSVIERSCNALLDGALPKELEIIVVCNGCTDNTAEVARSIGEDIIVLETDVPSKSNALNLGDRRATGYPRLYIDADVIIPFSAIKKVALALQNQEVLAAAPAIKVDLTGCPFWVKSFYLIWLQLPYCTGGMIGSGCYGLSQEGRKRFKEFPPIIADDGYIRLLFKPHERKTIHSCHSTIFPPKRLKNLLQIKSRAHFGNLELRQRYPALQDNEDKSYVNPLVKFLIKPTQWIHLIIYCCLRSVSRLTAWFSFRFRGHHGWNQDETSR